MSKLRPLLLMLLFSTTTVHPLKFETVNIILGLSGWTLLAVNSIVLARNYINGWRVRSVKPTGDQSQTQQEASLLVADLGKGDLGTRTKRLEELAYKLNELSQLYSVKLSLTERIFTTNFEALQRTLAQNHSTLLKLNVSHEALLGYLNQKDSSIKKHVQMVVDGQFASLDDGGEDGALVGTPRLDRAKNRAATPSGGASGAASAK